MKKAIKRSVAMVALAAAMVAHAGAPQVGTQAPGWYRMMLGDFEVTALSDGTVDLDVKQLLTNVKPREVDALLKRSFTANPVRTSVNGYLVNTGDKLVLIDTGAAGLFGPTLGKLVENLKASGYQPEQVDAVVITHLHPDHVGGVMANGQAVFPNATLHVDQRDAGYWLSAEQLAKAPEAAKGFFQGAMASAKPYADAGKLKTFDGNTTLVPGVRALAAYGHTPGHSVYAVESKGQKLLLWGDLMHVSAVQFAKPVVTIQFDVDSKSASVQRRNAYTDAAKGGYLVAAAHLPFPGIGRLRAEGAGYRFVPIDYAPVK
ncbi:MBL fold metallo-hydrolase [Aquincola sp. MAHUQ-54]|uniref:MBL fold metallo-hydrolase n=1 Tax=Aquincola agrisoli TaxID=3119538 RepID=A0AAW9Q763_9BURK